MEPKIRAMAMNKVQFQRGLSLAEFHQRYGTGAKCQEVLYRSPWPRGFRCPACGDRRRLVFQRGAQRLYQSRAYGHQTTLAAGTLLQDTTPPLTECFLAMHLLTTTETNLATLEPMRHLDVCYRTAWWRLKQKEMQAMLESEEPRHLDGFVQVDDAYLGGQRDSGEAGCGPENKQTIVAAVTADTDLEHPRYAVMKPVRRFGDAAITDWAERHLAPEAEAYSEGLGHFTRFVNTHHAHTVLVMEGGRAATGVHGARWVTVVLGNAKRAPDVTYHAIKQQRYARRHLGEAMYRFNRRLWLADTLPQLTRAVAVRKPRPEQFLRTATNFTY